MVERANGDREISGKVERVTDLSKSDRFKLLPPAVQLMNEAYGPKYRCSDDLIGKLARLIFSPEERSPEAVDAAWRAVYRYRETEARGG